MNLKEWTEIYLKHRNLHKGNMSNLERTDRGFRLHTTDGYVQIVVVEDTLTPQDAKDADIIVCLNTIANAKLLAAHWQEFLVRDLLIIFANPSTNEKWQIRTQIHDKIADLGSLEQGFVSMTESTGAF